MDKEPERPQAMKQGFDRHASRIGTVALREGNDRGRASGETHDILNPDADMAYASVSQAGRLFLRYR